MRKSLFSGALALIITAAILVAPTYADGTVDGTISVGYGAAVDNDPTGETLVAADEEYDLDSLYVYENGTDLFLGLTLDAAADITTNDFTKYYFFILTDNAANTDTNDPIGKNNIDSSAYSHFIGTWVDWGNGCDLYGYNGTSWVVDAATYGGPTYSMSFAKAATAIELSVPLAALGNPSTIEVAAVSSASGGNDTALDAIPSRTDPTGWSDPATISTRTAPVTVPVELSAFSLD
jgi:hypothetical protein